MERRSRSPHRSGDYVHPSMRVNVDEHAQQVYSRPWQCNDVLLVPNFICKERDFSAYQGSLVQIEGRQAQENMGWVGEGRSV
jgi:hypothetical protein